MGGFRMSPRSHGMFFRRKSLRMADDLAVAVAIYDYSAQDDTELSIKRNEKLVVIDDSQPWWKVQNERSLSGYVPSNYVQRKDSSKKKGNIIENLRSKLNKNKRQSGLEAVERDDSKAGTKVLGKTGHKILCICFAKYNYTPLREDELELRKGDQILVTEKEGDGWWKGEVNGRSGWFPNNYVDVTEQDLGVGGQPSEYATPSDVMQANVNINDFTKLPICKVRTLYPFSSQSPEELTFDKDVILEIIEKPKDDPDWWKARTSGGDIGLVPRNYVQEIESVVPVKPTAVTVSPRSSPEEDVTCSFVNEEWYHGAISRMDCEHLLKSYAKDGEFLVRASESTAGDYSLSMKAPGRIKHFRIKSEGGNYTIGQRSFEGMEQLVAHYKSSPIFTSDSGEKMFLVKAFSKADSTRNGVGYN